MMLWLVGLVCFQQGTYLPKASMIFFNHTVPAFECPTTTTTNLPPPPPPPPLFPTARNCRLLKNTYYRERNKKSYLRITVGSPPVKRHMATESNSTVQSSISLSQHRHQVYAIISFEMQHLQVYRLNLPH